MMIRHSQNLRPVDRHEECASALAIKLKAALDRHKARRAAETTEG